MWFRLALRVGGTTVEELKCRMSYTEFLRWVKFLEDEWDERDARDWQTAVVAYEVYLTRHVLQHLFAKSMPAPKLDIKDFLVKFKAGGDKVESLTPERLRQMEEDALSNAEGVRTIIQGLIPTE